MDTQKGFLRVHFLFGVEARMNLTSFLQDKRLMIALKGDIDHHGAKDVMRVLGNNMACLLKCIELGKIEGLEPVKEKKVMTNFIRG